MSTSYVVHFQLGFLKHQFKTVQGSDPMASAEREPMMGVQMQSPPVGYGEGRAKPPEAEYLLYFACPKKAINLTHY